MTWVWLLLAIAAEVVGTLSLRASDGLRRKRWLLVVAVAYLCAFGFLSLSLAAGMLIGVAYGIWTAVGIVAVALLARVIWRDPLTPRMIAGMVVIAAGVLLVELA
ncbi:SMR family transporter [Gordonia sinesedis]